MSKELYKDSMEQRNHINNKFTPTITILTAEIGGIIWCFTKIIDNVSNPVTLYQIFAFSIVIITSILFGLAVLNFVLCFTHYNFNYPDPSKVSAYIQENLQYIDQYSEKEILDNIMENISEDYLEIANHNNLETNKHSAYLNKCYYFIITTLAFMVVDFILVLFL